MPRRSAPSELSNVYDRLHNLDDESVLEFRANYLFMKQAPLYVSLEKKYKETKKKNRELKRMIDLLNRQNMELMERFAGQRYLETTTECMLSERFSKLSKESEQSKPESEVEIVSVKKENIVYEIIDESEPEPEPESEPEPDQIEEEVVEESEEVVEEEVVEESEEVVEESEEVVEEEVVEEEVVEESEDVVEEESEDVVEEESEEVVEEEVVEEEVVEEEEEEGVYEITINGTRYYVSNETDSAIYAVADDDEIGDEVGVFVNGKPIFMKQEESEKVVEEEEEEGVYEITINGKRYYVSNETDSTIYAVAEDDEIGEEVGAFVNGKATFHTSKVEQESEDQEEEEEGVYEITINGKRYYVSNETDSTIYAVAEDDEIGEEVGAFVNGVAKLN